MHVLRIWCACALAVWFVASPAVAEPQIRLALAAGHANMGQGGTPPSLAAVAAAPRQYFDTDAAYQLLLAYVAEVSGIEATPSAFRALLVSERVRVVDCVDSIETAGYASNMLVWFSRPCYDGEPLVTFRDEQVERPLFSLGCLNPVRARARWVFEPSPRTSVSADWGVMNVPARLVSTPTLYYCDCSAITGVTIVITGSGFVPADNW